MEDGDAISLSPELETVERKLNYAKQTLKTQADEARKTERQKNELVVYLAHDIKTPDLRNRIFKSFWMKILTCPMIRK